jgi:hypothetical protein
VPNSQALLAAPALRLLLRVLDAAGVQAGGEILPEVHAAVQLKSLRVFGCDIVHLVQCGSTAGTQ